MYFTSLISLLLGLGMLAPSTAMSSDWLQAQKWQRRLVLAVGLESKAMTAEIERHQSALGKRPPTPPTKLT